MKVLLSSLLVFFPILVHAIHLSTTTLSPAVNLGYAQYQGTLVQDKVTGATNTQFLGIRYAAPPTGTLRFNAPSPPSTTPGVQLADTQPPICYQAGPAGLSSFDPFLPGQAAGTDAISGRQDDADTQASEDCLFLNVITPGQLSDSQMLPVVVWIHGGGYTTGSASATGQGTFYDGNDLVRASQGQVVAVLIQYRLGLFGFLSGQKVYEGGALNAGLLDQQFALQWVQEHISKFGGDPSKVTIWGESAGAGSVIQHLVANNGDTQPPLFRAAMTSSTYLPPQYHFSDRIPETLYNETVSLSSCGSQVDTLNCLRGTDVEILQAANVALTVGGFFGTFSFIPVVDGTFITDSPRKLIQQGNVNVESIYSVTNSLEGNIFVEGPLVDSIQMSDYVSQLFPTLDAQGVAAVTALYSGLGSSITQANMIMGESIFICPTYRLLNSLTNQSFKGQFAVPPAVHFSDVAYYFNNGEFPANTDPNFGETFSESFMNYVRFLDPRGYQNTPISLSSWQFWSGTNEILFNQTDDNLADIHPIYAASDLLQRCQFWDTTIASTEQ